METKSLAARVDSLEIEIGRLSDRQGIADVYRRYTRGLNRYNICLLSKAFWPDARIQYGTTSVLRDQWIDDWRLLHERGLTSQAHHILNETIDIDGNTACVEAYLIAFHRSTDDKPAQIRAGRYIDLFERREGEWRIAERLFIPHFWAEVSSSFDANFLNHAWMSTSYGLGSEDKTDPSYQRSTRSEPIDIP